MDFVTHSAKPRHKSDVTQQRAAFTGSGMPSSNGGYNGVIKSECECEGGDLLFLCTITLSKTHNGLSSSIFERSSTPD